MPNILSKALAFGKGYLQSESVDHLMKELRTSPLAITGADNVQCSTCSSNTLVNNSTASSTSERSSSGISTPTSTATKSQAGAMFAGPEDEQAFNNLGSSIYDKALTYPVAKSPLVLME